MGLGEETGPRHSGCTHRGEARRDQSGACTVIEGGGDDSLNGWLACRQRGDGAEARADETCRWDDWLWAGEGTG